MGCSHQGCWHRAVETERQKRALREFEALSREEKERFYRRRVALVTKSQPVATLPGYERRRIYHLDLDHIVPIAWGWRYGISPLIMGNIRNLQFIPRPMNSIKGDKIGQEFAIDMVLNIHMAVGGDLLFRPEHDWGSPSVIAAASAPRIDIHEVH